MTDPTEWTDQAVAGGGKESPPPNRKHNQSWTSRKMDYINAANRHLSGGPFKVAVCILQHANQKTEKAWPTQETIAAEVRMSVRTVKRHVGELRRKGWVEVRVIRRDGKTYNVYTISWQNVQAILDTLAEERIARRAARNHSGNSVNGVADAVIPFKRPGRRYIEGS